MKLEQQLAELTIAMRMAATSGRSAVAAATSTWERINGGNRAGLNEALLQLVAQGVVAGEIAADDRYPAGRKILGVVAVTQGVTMEVNEEVDQDEVPGPKAKRGPRPHDMSIASYNKGSSMA